MAKKKNNNLIKNLIKSIDKTIDSVVKYIAKKPITIKGKTKGDKGHDISAKIGGSLSKQDKDFIKSGKKFRISTQNGKHTVFEI